MDLPLRQKSIPNEAYSITEEATQVVYCTSSKTHFGYGEIVNKGSNYVYEILLDDGTTMSTKFNYYYDKGQIFFVKPIITLSNEQRRVVELLENGNENYFITGKAGCGKSFLLKYFREHTRKKVAVVAPTGIAAMNVEGATIHKLFGLPLSPLDPDDKGMIMRCIASDDRKALLKELETLIIDEISMVSCEMLDVIDEIFRRAKENYKPFGGCQIIAFGDMYQLPPVNKNRLEYTKRKYNTRYFFGALVYRKNPFTKIELVESHRQSDRCFVNILNCIRVGNISYEMLESLNDTCQRKVSNRDEEIAIRIATTNAVVDEINRFKLGELLGESRIFIGRVEGDFSEYPTAVELELKKGAQVMMLCNDSEGRWVNGSIGTICELTNESINVAFPGVEDNYQVDRYTWRQYTYKYNEELHQVEEEEIGSFEQFPLKLAYAITVHKAQGLTLESVILDYSKSAPFEPGQTYVALSRCKSIEHLYFTRKLFMSDIKTEKEIIDFMNGTNNHLPSDNPRTQLTIWGDDDDDDELPF